MELAAEHDVPAGRIGTVGGAGEFADEAAGLSVRAPVEELRAAYRGAIPRIMEAPTSSGD